VRDFPLLWLLGNDLPGAVVLNDRDGIPIPPPDVAGSDRSPGPPPLLRFSLAGVQLKFSAAGDPQRGLTIPASGTGGHWIVKLPDQRFERVPENEFAMMTFARDVGIEVPEIALVQIGDLAGLPGDIRLAGNAYAIKRFDRTGDGGRIHTEDFAQANVLYPREKYERFNFDLLVEQVAQVMGTDAALEIIQRIVFTIGIGNGDMHAKNWSVRYVDGRTPTLAPAYDYVSTVVYLPDDDIGMNLAGSKRFMDVDEEHFARLAARARLPRKPVLDTVRTMVERMRERWPILAGSLTIDPAQRDRITAHMDRLPLFAARGGG
jgi:serine/threonine-protein kinase HipA